jgi:micrococcal nuclease
MIPSLLLSLLLAATPQTARVVTVHDGDTITVRIDGHTEKVRLVGIDSPELQDERREYRDAAYAARDYARSRLGGETVTLETEPHQADRDKYGRLLRYVILSDGTNINEDLVRKGFARVYDKFQFTLKPRFKAAEAEAKREKLGVWKLPPGPWRDVPRTP